MRTPLSCLLLLTCSACADVAPAEPPPDETIEAPEPLPAGVDASQLAEHEAALEEALALHEGPPLETRLAAEHIKVGLAALRYPVNDCAGQAGLPADERVEVSFLVDGPTGTVRDAVVGGKHADTEFGQCTTKVCKTATFARFAASEQSFRYRFALRPVRM